MKDYTNKIITIPNILSIFRLLLVPPIVVFLLLKNNVWAIVFIAVSAVTDISDGFIARKFNMISNVGRVLDPIADKLTQLAILVCLGVYYNLMFALVGLLIVKEVVSGIIGINVVKMAGKTFNSEWHGKLATFLIYGTVLSHIVFQDKLPFIASTVLISVCIAVVFISFILYLIRYYRIAKKIKEKDSD